MYKQELRRSFSDQAATFSPRVAAADLGGAREINGVTYEFDLCDSQRRKM
jgi:hypothetical protein